MVQIPSVNSTKGVCFACNESIFNYNPADNKCYCKVGWLVGEYCTTIIGCISTKEIGNNVICVACDIAKHFELKNQTCVCSLGL